MGGTRRLEDPVLTTDTSGTDSPEFWGFTKVKGDTDLSLDGGLLNH